MKPRTALILTGKPEQARKSQHIADLLEACQGRPLRPGVYNVVVRHDSWCNLLVDLGPCNCRPDIEITEAR
jgi:hypothetical protein